MIDKELPFDFSDDTGPIGKTDIGLVHFADETVKIAPPENSKIFQGYRYPGDLKEKPAFCRRCFKFWRSVASSAPNAILLEYCCTPGNNKGRLLKTLISL